MYEKVAILSFFCLFFISCLSLKVEFDKDNDMYRLEYSTYISVYRNKGVNYLYTFDTVTKKEKFMIIFRDSSPEISSYNRAVSGDGVRLQFVENKHTVAGALWIENSAYFSVPESYLFELKNKSGSFEFLVSNEMGRKEKIKLKYKDIKNFLEGVEKLRSEKELNPAN